jgi:hypothetical protein
LMWHQWWQGSAFLKLKPMPQLDKTHQRVNRDPALATRWIVDMLHVTCKSPYQSTGEQLGALPRKSKHCPEGTSCE